MDLVNSVAAENIFISTASQKSQLEELANRELSNGIDLYMKKDYEGAIKEFQRSIGLAPQYESSVDASNYMANANTSKTFTMEFIFSKKMDRDSVEDRYGYTMDPGCDQFSGFSKVA